MKLEWNKKNRTKLGVYLLTVAASLAFLYFGNRIASSGMGYLTRDQNTPPVKAQVLRIFDKTSDSYSIGQDTTLSNQQIRFEAQLLSGEMKGTKVAAVQSNDSFMQLDEVQPGDQVLLYYVNSDDGSQWMMGEYNRTDGLMVLGGVFLLSLILFGRRKGVNTILSLAFTCLAVFCVFIPSVISGQNIYLSSVIVCVFVIIMTLLLVSGLSRKSVAAMAGCFAGVALSGGLTLVMNQVLRLTGRVDEESLFLSNLNAQNPIDLKAIIFAAITIGAMGAIMDVAISIASSLWELHEQAGDSTPRMLIRSGFTIGRDMMGTMANTLVLAYIGSSLSMVLLLIAYNSSMLALLNREMIVVEILQALVGSLGILFTIPLTSVICAGVYHHRRREKRPKSPVVRLDMDAAFQEDEDIQI